MHIDHGGVSPGVAMATGTPKTEKFSAATLLSYCSHGVSHQVADAEVDGKQVGAPDGQGIPQRCAQGDRDDVRHDHDGDDRGQHERPQVHLDEVRQRRDRVRRVGSADSTAFGPIADFGSISFTAGAVGGKALGSVSPAGTPYNMQTSKGILQVVTGPLTSTTKNAFTTTWKHL